MPYKVTDKEFKQRVYSQVGDEYITLTPYKKATEKVEFKHMKCKHTFFMTPNHFLVDHRRCSYCYNGNAISPIDYAKLFSKLSHGEYKQLTPYHRSSEKIKVKHIKCGYTYWINPTEFTRAGHRCPKCFGNQRKTIYQFKKEVNRLTNGEYECISKTYKNNRTPVIVKHKLCGHTYKVNPHDFVEGNRCPFCRQSKGEKFVQKILDLYNIRYRIQKRFEWCRRSNGSYLPFDFYLPDYNLCIEYDGVQHYKPVRYFGGLKKLKSQQNRDSFKNNKCLEHDVSVLRIPYNLSKEHIKNNLLLVIQNINARSHKPIIMTMI